MVLMRKVMQIKMKKITKTILPIFILLVCISSYAYTWGEDYWNINLESNIDFNFGENYSNDRLLDLEYIRGFNNKPLLLLDLSFFKDNWHFLTEGTILSLRPPVVIDLDSFFTPMIKLGYLEYDNEFILFSIGRRKQSIGISDYNLFVNRDMPFYDGLNFSIGKEKGFKYDSLISVSNLNKIYRSETQPTIPATSIIGNSEKDLHTYQLNKYFLYHSISYIGKTWFLMIGESAILANPKSIGDLSIFNNIHNENSERANVGMEFQFGKIFKDKIFISSMFAIDDLPARSDHSDPTSLAETPSAVALGFGVKWHALKGELFKFPSSNQNKGIKENTNFGEMKGGLIVSLDYVATSRWFYIRSNTHKSSQYYFHGFQSFYNYFYNPQFNADHDHYSVPFGLKYGGDTQLLVLKGLYETTNYKISSAVEVALLGQDARERMNDFNYWGNANLSTDSSDNNYSKNWITSGNIKPLIIINADFEKGITSNITAYVGSSLSFGPENPTLFNFNLGTTIQF